MVCVGHLASVFTWFELVCLRRWLDGLLWSAPVGGWIVYVGQPVSVVGWLCWSASLCG